MPSSSKTFPPLESDPDLFTALLHKLGTSPKLHFEDVLSLEEEDLNDLIPGRILAFVLLQFTDEHYDKNLVKEETARMATLSEEEKRSLSESVMWVKQTIHNACGFYGLLHAVCNIAQPLREAYILPGSFLCSFLATPSREDRQKLLETSQTLEDAYIPIALQGQTKAPDDWDIEPPYHYICYLEVDGQTWELDGDRQGPVKMMEGEGVLDVLRRRVEGDSSTGRSLLALVEKL